MAGRFVVGNAFVRLRTEAKGLRAEMRAQVQKAAAGLRAEVEMVTDDKGLRARVTAATKKAQAGQKVQIESEVDTAGMRSKVTAATKKAQAGQEVKVGTDLDATGLAAKARAAVALADKAAGKIKVGIEFNRSALNHLHRGLARVKTEARMAGRGLQAFRPMLGLVITGALMLGEALFHVIGSMGKAVTAAMALPVAFGAVAQGAIAAALAMNGVMESMREWELYEDLKAVDAPPMMLARQLAKAKAAMEDLGPAGKKMVMFIRKDWMPAMRDLQLRVREAFFPHVLKGLKLFARHAEGIADHMARMADTTGRAALRMAEWATSARSLQQFGDISRANNGILSRLADTAINLLDVLRNLWHSAIPLTQRFTRWLVRATGRLRDLTDQASRSGKLTKFFNEAGDEAARWGRILGNVAVALFNTFKAATGSTSKFMDGLERVTRKWREWTESFKGQKAMRNFFSTLRELPWGRIAKTFAAMTLAMLTLKASKGVFALLGALFAPAGVVALGIAAIVGGFLTLIAVNKDFRDMIVGTAKRIGDKIGPKFEGFGDTLKRIGKKMEPVVATLISFVEDFMVGFSETWPTIEGSLETLAGVLGDLAKAYSEVNDEVKKATGKSLLKWVGIIAGGLIIGAINTLVVALEILVVWLKLVRMWVRNVATVLGALRDAAQATGRWFAREWRKLVNDFRATWEDIKGIWNGVKSFFTKTIPAAARHMVDGWKKEIRRQLDGWRGAWDLARDIWRNFTRWLGNAWSNFWRGIVKWFDDHLIKPIKQFWHHLFGNPWLLDTFKGFVRRLTEAWRNFWRGLVNWFGDHFVKPVKRRWKDLLDSLQGMWRKARSFFTKSIPDAFRSMRESLRDIWNGIGRNAAKLVNGIGRVFSKLPGTIRRAFDGALDKIREFIERIEKIPGVGIAKNVIKGLKGGISGALASIPGIRFPGLAQGGRVRGPGTSTSDSIPTLLSNDEYVVRAASRSAFERRYGQGAMEHVNRYGVLPGDIAMGRAATGGSVSEIIAYARRGGFTAPVTSSYRTTPDYHGRGLAVDFGGYGQQGLGQHFQKVGTMLYELIHNLGGRGGRGGGFSIKDGRNVSPSYWGAQTWGQHADHLHVAARPGFSQAGRPATGSTGGFGFGGIDVLGKVRDIWDKLKGGFGRALKPLNNVPFGPNIKGIAQSIPKGIMDWAATQGGPGGPLVGASGSVMRQALAQAQTMNATKKVLLALFEAGFVESNFRNGPAVRFKDHDSAGFLQQRPSQGWGTLAQVENVPYATRSFVSRAMPIQGRYGSAGRLAQAVQRSAFPDRYDQAEGRARAALRSLGAKGFGRGGVVGGTGNADLKPLFGSPGERMLTHPQSAYFEGMAAGKQMGGNRIDNMTVLIPAKDLKEMKDVRDFMDRIEAETRKGPTRRIP